jgi:transglutaminase-like putative cysteine protease
VSLFWTDPPRETPTHVGDVVITQRASFTSQEHQIRYLRELVNVYRGHPAIRARARDIIFRLDHCSPRNEVEYAIALARWVQQNITYCKEMPEVFQTPPATVALGYGDCDDHVTLLASLVESVGIETEIIGLEWDAPKGSPVPRAFQHIFSTALPMGRRFRLPLDTTLVRPMEDLTDPLKIGRDAGLRLRIFVA